jgi:hypothetical protein
LRGQLWELGTEESIPDGGSAQFRKGNSKRDPSEICQKGPFSEVLQIFRVVSGGV